MTNNYNNDDSDAMGTYHRDLLKTRRNLREALAEAQTNHDRHAQPLYRQRASASAIRAHQLVLDMVSEIAPRQNQVPGLWQEARIADYQHPVADTTGLAWQSNSVIGLQEVLEWRNVHLPREQQHAGDTAASADIVQARAYMPVEVMSGARHKLDNALAKIGWLPEGEPGDFIEPEPSI